MTFHARLSVLAVAASTFWSPLTGAQTDDGATPPPGKMGATADASPAAQPPPARRGFQLAVRTGYSAPVGNVWRDVPMSDWFRGQVPFAVDVGGKIGDYVFLGVFFSISAGGAGDSVTEVCVDCASIGVWIGPEVHVSFLPAGKVDPWLGYGLGLEYNSVGDDVSVIDLTGFVPLLMSGGVDFRLSRIFGLGPFVGMAVGTYSEVGAGNGDVDISVEIDEKAAHGWLTLGVRGVFFP